jgi:hypothetical protein
VYKTAFKNFPISSAKFSADGRELLLGSEYKASMQSFDLRSNKATIIPAPMKGPEISNMEVRKIFMEVEFKLERQLSHTKIYIF